MAFFFLGQRVRLVRGRDLVSPAKRAGMEGRIVALVFTPKGTFAGDGGIIPFDCDCAVEWDGELGSFAQNTAQLEPILPSGHTASTESLQELMDRLNTQRVEKVEEVGA